MNWKTSLVLVVLLGALLAVVMLTKGDPEKTSGGRQRMVPGFLSDQVKSIRIENAERNEKMLLVKENDGWSLTEPLKTGADPTQAKFIADFFAVYEGTPIGKAGDGKLKLAELGLDRPRAFVEVEMIDGKKVGAKIGADDLKGNDLYLQIDDEVFRAPRTIYNSVSKPSSDLRDRRIFTVPTYDIARVEISRGGATAIAEKEGADWRLAAPFRGRADAGALGKIVTGVAVIRVLEFVNDTPASYALYGLENPEMALILKAGDKTQKLLVGATKGDRTFVQRDGLKEVWTVAESDLAPARRSAEDLRDADVFGSFPVDSVKSLRWKTDAGEIAFEYDAATRKTKLTAPRAAEADRDATEAAVKAVESLKAEGFVAAGANPAEYGLASPTRRIELLLKEAKEATKVDVGVSNDQGTFLKREKDEYFLRVPTASLAFLTKPATDFVSKEVVAIDSYLAWQAEIDAVLDGEKRTVTFRKDDSNKWTTLGATEENKPFSELADSLWHAKATELLPADPATTALADVLKAARGIEVRVFSRFAPDATPEDKEKKRVATLRFAATAPDAWLALGITGAATTGGFAMKIAPEIPQKVLALAFPGAASQPTSLPK